MWKWGLGYDPEITTFSQIHTESVMQLSDTYHRVLKPECRIAVQTVDFLTTLELLVWNARSSLSETTVWRTDVVRRQKRQNFPVVTQSLHQRCLFVCLYWAFIIITAATDMRADTFLRSGCRYECLSKQGALIHCLKCLKFSSLLGSNSGGMSNNKGNTSQRHFSSLEEVYCAVALQLQHESFANFFEI